MMSCPIQTEKLEVLLDYTAGRLAPELRPLFETHMENCGECRRFAKGQAAVWESLDSWEPPLVSSDFDRMLYARIERHEQAPWWRRTLAAWPGPISWKPALSVGAACAALFAGVILYSPDLSEPKVKVEAVDLEQVERTLEDLEMLRQLTGSGGAQEI